MKKALRIEISGIVQGVGFRPFVFNLAKSFNLKGHISNSCEGVSLLLEGEEEALQGFLHELPRKAPPLSQIYEIKVEEAPLSHFKELKIIKSETTGRPSFDILPDLALCKECSAELYSPENRRYLYPFITCTQCGPRFSILEKIPYERENTAMKFFKMCEDCLREYTSPQDRRFHAEPIACPKCGPTLELMSSKGELLARDFIALEFTASLLREGNIIALKGLTGFHLLARADSKEVVENLRKRKERGKKPFAVMFRDLEELEKYVFLEEEDKRLLTSPKAPILILKSKGLLPQNLAEGLDCLGVFLPYTPIHLLLLNLLDFPLVATSGNLSGEPIIFENEVALAKLSKVADYFLLHNRPIRRALDDSVIKKMKRGYILVRRARGYVPQPIFLKQRCKEVILAVGAQEKNTFALAWQNKVIISQHLGDLESPATQEHFERTLLDFLDLYRLEPKVVIADLHPQYFTTLWAKTFAKERGLALWQVQHHHAHILSVLAEKGVPPEEEVLGVAFDGTGYGSDNTIWGGEFLLVKGPEFKRIFTLRPFRLLGGERAIKDTRRIALALLLEIFGKEALKIPLPLWQSFTEEELSLLFKMWQRGLNSPLTTSVGRLFDGVSALLGVNYYNSYSGESAMKLEALYQGGTNETYPLGENEHFFDWEEMIREMIFSKEELSLKVTKFINTLAKLVEVIALRVGLSKVALSGGVMMNAPLVYQIKERLSKQGFKVLTNELVPPNDGGISLGQAYFGALAFKV